MIVEFDKSFHKSLNKLGSQSVAHDVIGAIANVESASLYEEIKQNWLVTRTITG